MADHDARRSLHATVLTGIGAMAAVDETRFISCWADTPLYDGATLAIGLFSVLRLHRMRGGVPRLPHDLA